MDNDEKKWTPEPWKTAKNFWHEKGLIVGHNDKGWIPLVADMVVPMIVMEKREAVALNRDEIEANSDRIVACVNACAHLGPDPAARIAELEVENERLRDRLAKSEGALGRANKYGQAADDDLLAHKAAVAVLAAELARWRGVVGASCREWDLLDPFCKATDANPIASAAIAAGKENHRD